ncbi:HNH endonuclease [Halosegnis longus]|uniref:HNH endonuclease n=2 Tax=Halosegnis longus TaxID=2216012 RepID=A0AAJ4R8Q7_9EURY|nr:HNH endonuclease [Salella cibi]
MPNSECPTCNRSLATEQGMRQHHTKVHGTPLPNRTCESCRDRFYDPKSRRTYCKSCYTGRGQQNGNWKDAKTEATCRNCESTFEYYPSEKTGVFCGDCVENTESFLGTPSHELRRAPRKSFSCEQCGDSFELLASAVDGAMNRGRFCSHDCRSTWLSQNRTGPAHHQWVAEEGSYSGAWWQVRSRALERDEHTCQHCGAGVEELGQNPDVHHITPVRTFEDPDDAHHLDNVVCLCRTCHPKVEAGSLPCPEI